ncbi:MAG: guanylate kinase [Firmicutes bacterium]|nr:guanylate kinase [Bacillota bacterium]
MSDPGLLLILSGPSGVGKGTVCKRLLQTDANTTVSVSATTRQPRQGEVDGEHYHFLTKEDFLHRIAGNEFLEWAEVFGNYYGTLKSEVDRQLNAGKNVILEIDVQGAMQIKTACPHGIFVFILPPSLEELENRIRLRATENDANISMRLAKAEEEIGYAKKYDYQIVNDDVDRAVAQILGIIAAEKAKRFPGA